MKIFLNYIISSIVPLITFLSLFLVLDNNENGQGKGLIIIGSALILRWILLSNCILFLNYIPLKNIIYRKTLIIITNLFTPMVFTYFLFEDINFENKIIFEIKLVFLSLVVSYSLSILFITKMLKSLYEK